MRRLTVIVSLLAVSLSGILASTASAAASGPLGKVTVEGEEGREAHVEVRRAVLDGEDRPHGAGGRNRRQAGQRSEGHFDYVVVDGRTGKELATSFGSTQGTALLDKSQVTPGIVSGFLDANVGSRVLVAVAPKEGVAKGLASSGVKKSDTLLFLIDVKTVRTPLDRAQGAAVTPASGLPTVQLDGTGKPTITVPGVVRRARRPGRAAARHRHRAGRHRRPDHHRALHRGDLRQRQAVRLVVGPRQPIDFPIGTGKVIAGWDEGIVGQTVGSQVLLVVPPDKGYGTNGNSSAGISGTDSLVFVVDILDAY